MVVMLDMLDMLDMLPTTDSVTLAIFSGLVASMTNPPRGGPRKAERPLMQVRTPKAEVRCSRPRIST